jgi:hypothetical protein
MDQLNFLIDELQQTAIEYGRVTALDINTTDAIEKQMMAERKKISLELDRLEMTIDDMAEMRDY